MKQNVICLLCCISVILIVVASGCITPPKENATILKKGTTADGKAIPWSNCHTDTELCYRSNAV